MAEAICEQLVYTWAVRAGGTAGFDVAATSPGFDPAFVPKAKLVCEHPGEPQDPAAFGWVPVGDRVMWFRRGSDEPDGFGRRGTFCAHVRVADRVSIGPGAVAAALCSDSWITGRSRLEGQTLNTIGVDRGPVQPSRAINSVDATIAAAALESWARGGRLAVLGDPAVLQDVIAVLTASAPWMFSGRSFCSWLHRGAKGVFSIQGITDRNAAPADALVVELEEPIADPDVLELVSGILGSEPSAEADAAISAARSADGSIDYGDLVRTYKTSMALRDGESLSADRVVELLSTPGTATLAYANAGFRSRAAALATGQRPDVWDRLAGYAGAAKPAERRALGQELWRFSVKADPTLSSQRAARVDGEIWFGYVLAAADDIDANPGLVDRLGESLLRDLGAVRPAAAWMVTAAYRSASLDPVSALSDERLDMTFRGVVAAAAVRRADAASIRRLVADERLVTAGAHIAREEGCLVNYAVSIAGAAADRTRVYLSCVLPNTAVSEVVALGAAAVSSASIEESPGVLATFTGKLSRRAGVEWRPLALAASEAAADSVKVHGWPPRLPRGVTQSLAVMATDPVAAAWIAADAPIDSQDPSADVAARAVALQALPERNRKAAAMLAFDRVGGYAPDGSTMVAWHQQLIAETDAARTAEACILIARYGYFGLDPIRLAVVALGAVGQCFPDSINPRRRAPGRVYGGIRTLLAELPVSALMRIATYRAQLEKWILRLINDEIRARS